MSVNEAVSEFYDQLYAVFIKHVPKKISSHKQYPPWFNFEMIRLLRQKNRAHSKYMKSKGDVDYNNFKDLRILFKQSVKDAYARYIEEAEISLKTDPNKFWSFLNSKNSSTRIPSTMNYKNNNLEDPQDIVNSFADFFSSAFINSTEYVPDKSICNNNILCIREFDENDVRTLLKELKQI